MFSFTVQNMRSMIRIVCILFNSSLTFNLKFLYRHRNTHAHPLHFMFFPLCFHMASLYMFFIMDVVLLKSEIVKVSTLTWHSNASVRWHYQILMKNEKNVPTFKVLSNGKVDELLGEKWPREKYCCILCLIGGKKGVFIFLRTELRVLTIFESKSKQILSVALSLIKKKSRLALFLLGILGFLYLMQ